MNLTFQKPCASATCLDNLRKDVLVLGTTLEDTQKATKSAEIKKVIACLVTLDHVVACQTHLNELHESHTGNNFKEQRVLNEVCQPRIRETIKSVIDKSAFTGAQRH
jgi:hypothetical protein